MIKKELEYKGVQYPVCIDFDVIEIVCEELKINFFDALNIAEDPNEIEILFKHSLFRGYQLTEKGFDITEDLFEDLISDQYISFIQMFADFINGMQVVNSAIELPMKTDFSVIKKLCSKFNLRFKDLNQVVERPGVLIFAFQLAVKRGYKRNELECPYTDEQLKELFYTNCATYVQSFIVDVLSLNKDVDQEVVAEEIKKKVAEQLTKLN